MRENEHTKTAYEAGTIDEEKMSEYHSDVIDKMAI